MSGPGELRTCGKCGAPLAGSTPEGLCAGCLLQSAFEDTEEDARGQGALTAFGDYELLEEIARGGMGVVYRARQISLNRMVALKMILAGRLAAPAEMRRFQTEAETAARLQHPGIVAIHEVGEHEGCPYFSMDYVAGRTLAELTREGPLPAPQAARYVEMVARAIQHAHNHGVLHRDLKPSNVLIDGNDQPRVTDFGLAKWLEGKTEVTLTAHVIGSPSFMPPEQAAGGAAHVGVYSDVYSLGAVLYQLVTGRPPFVAASATATLRMVAEQEPVSPRLLNASVSRDLETICLKCLEKDPKRRYKSAQELAEELTRFIGGEPIHARPAGRAEKVWRWCRREPALAATAGLAVLLLILAGIGTSVAAWRIDRERARSQRVAEFLKDMLKTVAPSVALGRDTTLLREFLDKTSTRVSTDLTNYPAVEAELLDTIGESYRALTVYDKAEASHRRALGIRTRLFGEGHADSATSMDNLGVVLLEQTKLPEAERFLTNSLAKRRKLFGREAPEIATSLSNLGVLRQYQGNFAEAERLYTEALQMRRKLLGPHHLQVAESLMCLASGLYYQHKDLPKAEALNLEALTIWTNALGEFHPDVANCLNNLAMVYLDQGKEAQAEATLGKFISLWRALLKDGSAQEAQGLSNLGWLLCRQGKLAKSEDMLRQALTMRRQVLGQKHDSVAESMNTLAVVLQRRGKLDEAEQLQRDQLTMLIQLHTTNHFAVANSKNNLSWLLRSRSKFAEAEQLILEALATQRKVQGETNWDSAQMLQNLGALYIDQGKMSEAEKAYGDALGQTLAVCGKDDLRSAGSMLLLAHLLCAQGRPAEALSWAKDSLAVYEAKQRDRWPFSNAQAVLGRCLMALTNYSEAKPLLESGCAGLERLIKTIPFDKQVYMKEALQSLAKLYELMEDEGKVADARRRLEQFEQIQTGTNQASL